MAWEHAKTVFPNGYTTPSGKVITAEQLQKSKNIHVLSQQTTAYAREMVTQIMTQIWGENGEYAEGIDYDIYAAVPHPDPNCRPLSVYGQSMVNNFLYLNDIDP